MTGDAAHPTPCVWLTGRRGAGKRTIAGLAASCLREEGIGCAVLDAEDLAAHLRFGPAEGVDAPAEVCAARSGVDDRTYEEPIAPDRRVPTADRDARAAAALLVSHLEELLGGG